VIDLWLGIVGAGVVGSALARAFVEHVRELKIYDIRGEKATHSVDDVLGRSDVVFICLPTPQKEGSLECDTGVIEDFLSGVAGSAKYRNANLVIRSTVPIGFTRRMREKYGLPNLCHSPEFLTARCALIDAQMPSRNIIGYPGYWKQDDGHPTPVLEKLYAKRWPHVQTFFMDSDESEAVKLYTNTFFAAKVSLFNEFQHDATLRGLDWGEVRDAMLAGGSIHPSHTVVPGPASGEFGYGGACLVKDAANFIDCAVKAGGEPMVATAAHTRNSTIDRKRTS
jgi:UDPglucose 6-dehydrogenase